MSAPETALNNSIEGNEMLNENWITRRRDSGKRMWRVGLPAAVLFGVLLIGNGPTLAAVISCGKTISMCGCTITKPGTYNVNASLSYTQGLTKSGDCIEISASKVILNLAGYDIAGAGAGTATGDGIKVLGGANNVSVLGSYATIQGWKNGMEIDGNNCLVNATDTNANGVAGIFLNKASDTILFDSTSHNNGTAGIYVNNSNGTSLSDFSSHNNGTAGIYVNNSSGAVLSAFDSYSNGTAGVVLKQSSGARITAFDSYQNTIYGVLLNQSSGNLIGDFNIYNNKIGVYLGCRQDGTYGTKCTGAGAGSSNNNLLVNGTTQTNNDAGTVIDVGDLGNIVATYTSTNNSGTYDSVDENANCGTNQWLSGPAGNYGKVSQSCIP
jgi:hypothetical protein